MILSLTEGDDKPLKYPLMFEKSDVVLINKVDAAPVFDFDFERANRYIQKRHPGVPVFPLSSKTGEGYEALMEWLVREIRQWNN